MTGAEWSFLAAAFGFGVASAVLPWFLNAEIYVVAMGGLASGTNLFFGIMALTIGTVLGKELVFEGIRRGAGWAKKDVSRREPRYRWTRALRRWSDQLLTQLDHPYRGGAVVFLSSLLSFPPLFLVTVLAALSKQPAWLFLVMVFVGRAIQFFAIAYFVHGLT